MVVVVAVVISVVSHRCVVLVAVAAVNAAAFRWWWCCYCRCHKPRLLYQIWSIIIACRHPKTWVRTRLAHKRYVLPLLTLRTHPKNRAVQAYRQERKKTHKSRARTSPVADDGNFYIPRANMLLTLHSPRPYSSYPRQAFCVGQDRRRVRTLLPW